MSRFLCTFIASLLSFSLLLAPSGSIELNEINKTEDSQSEIMRYLEITEWQVNPNATSAGRIHDYAESDTGLCAIRCNDMFYVFHGGKQIASYHFSTTGSCKILFSHDWFIIYAARSGALLCTNPFSQEQKLFTIDKKSEDHTISTFMGEWRNHPYKPKEEGYYLRNKNQRVPRPANTFDELVFIENGKETILYSSNARKDMLMQILIFNAIAGLVGVIFSVVWTKWRRSIECSEGAVTQVEEK